MITDHSCLIFWNDLLVIVKHVNVTSQADDVWNTIKERCYHSPHSCQGAVMLSWTETYTLFYAYCICWRRLAYIFYVSVC